MKIMVHLKIIHGILVSLIVLFEVTMVSADISNEDKTVPMTVEEREELKEEARDMFYHAYRAYMENAYPADELMPLSCQGRWKDSANSRGDLDDVLGNFSLTLIDTLDTLVILGDLEEFEHAVRLVLKDVSFDQDVVVSVFETNIRVLGGLVSAHILAEYLQQRAGIMLWYHAELLTLAKDLGYRLLPAFNTTTGIPHSRVNLRHGLKNMRLSAHQETCTACAGTMILEMAALSRLTGEPLFEQKAHRAMDELWRMRHRSSDLMGTVLNVQSGDWVRRDSGVGAGIDSYYEYCLKAYILLGDEKYLGRFNRHYNAIMKYVSQGPLLVDVHMHRPHTNSKNFMDALLAFWPGLQVLKGDIKPAVATHEMLYQVMQRHNLIPEAFTTDFQVHWGQHPLRPEFVESTYFLYKATNDPYYLEVGKAALKSLQKYARVPCGYATVKDVRTGGHDDRMDSFVLAETFKYLYLLFADPSELVLDLDEFLFTTEAHLLPLSLSRSHNSTVITMNDQKLDDSEDFDAEFARSCPNTLNLFPESVRKPLKNMVDGICPRRTMKRKLLASQFITGNTDHLKLLKDMGITVLSMADGRVQLLHSAVNARSTSDAEEGILFMQEMVELSQAQKQVPDKAPLSVSFPHKNQIVSVSAGPAHFGKDLNVGMKVSGRVAVADPLRACETMINPKQLRGRIVIIERGDCMFINKVRKVEEGGAIGAIVIDNTPGSSSMTSSMFAMSGDGKNDVSIPAVFLFYQDASQLFQAIQENPLIEITIAETSESDNSKTSSDDLFEPPDSIFNRIRFSIQDLLGTTVSTPNEVNMGEFRATVERLAGGKEIIRIAESSQTLKEGSLDMNENLLFSLKEVMKKSIKNGKRELEVPSWLLRMYHKLGTHGDETNSEEQRKWLLAQLRDLSLEADIDTIENDNQNENIKKVSDNIFRREKLEKTDSESVSNDVSKIVPGENSLRTNPILGKHFPKLDPASTKFLCMIEYQLMKAELSDKLYQLKLLLEKQQPKGWQKLYLLSLAELKTVLRRLENFPQTLPDDDEEEDAKSVYQNSDSDLNNEKFREFKVLIKNRKEKLVLLKFAVTQLEQVSRVFLDSESINDNSAKTKPKDDIIISNIDENQERTSSSNREIKNKNDEL